MEDRVQVVDGLVATDQRRRVHAVGELWRTAPEEVVSRRVEDRPVAVLRRGDVRVEVVADLGQLVLREAVDVEGRAEEPELLTAEPDEPQLVARLRLAHLLRDVEDRRRTGRVV